MSANTIAEIRKEFEEIDRQVLGLIGRRMQLSQKIAGLKQQAGIGIIQADIWHQQMRERKKEGHAIGVDEAFVVKLYSLIHDESVRVQRQALEVTV